MRRIITCAVLCCGLAGCGADVAFSTLYQSGLKVKQAKDAEKTKEEIVKKVAEAMSKEKAAGATLLADVESSVSGEEASIVPKSIAAPDVSSAMKAAEEQSK